MIAGLCAERLKSESNLNAGEIRLLLLYVARLSLGMDNGVKITALVIVSPLFRLRFILTFGSQPSPSPRLEINSRTIKSKQICLAILFTVPVM